MNMKGTEDFKKFLYREARSSQLILPKHWANVYKNTDEKAEKDFIQETLYQTLFRETLPFPRNLVSHWFTNVQESLQCLHFLHDTGMLLWYGQKNDNLRNIIFHHPSFPLPVLQSLFKHDLIKDCQKFSFQFCALILSVHDSLIYSFCIL